MKTKLYGVFDKINNSYINFCPSVSDTSAVRDCLPMCRMIPMKDMEIRAIGEINDKNEISLFKDYFVIDWSLYELPKDEDQATAPLKAKDQVLTMNDYLSIIVTTITPRNYELPFDKYYHKTTKYNYCKEVVMRDGVLSFRYLESSVHSDSSNTEYQVFKRHMKEIEYLHVMPY